MFQLTLHAAVVTRIQNFQFRKCDSVTHGNNPTYKRGNISRCKPEYSLSLEYPISILILVLEKKIAISLVILRTEDLQLEKKCYVN